MRISVKDSYLICFFSYFSKNYYFSEYFQIKICNRPISHIFMHKSNYFICKQLIFKKFSFSFIYLQTSIIYAF